MICGVRAPPRTGPGKKVSVVRAGDNSGPVSHLMMAVVAGLSWILAFRKLDDFDTWWHLAAGRWIANHGSIPATDTLSHTARDHPWVNLQWGFDLGVYWLDRMGGPAALALACALGFALAFSLVFRLVRRPIGDVPGAALVIVGILAAQDRFAVRPELLSFPLLAAVLTVLASSRRYWLLPPLMLLWVNVHALFVIGVFAILAAIAGSLTARPRSLWLWGGVSLAAVVVNPFGASGALFPLKLLSRIDRSNPVFQAIAEFRSPFSSDAAGFALVAYKVLLAVACLALGATILRRWRRKPGATLDVGGLIFFAGLAALSIAARRNAALFAIGSLPFIASCLKVALDGVPARVRASLGSSIAAGAIATGVALFGAGVVTGSFYKWDRQPREFGIGVVEGIFPIRAAAAVREAKLPGKLYNDLASGGYLTWDDPIGDGVFIDGRLEVYDTAFYAEYVQSMYDPARFAALADRYGIQTVLLFHHWENRRLLVERLFHSGAWALVYADETAAVFVRPRGNDDALQRASALTDPWNAATRAWLDRPVPRWPYPAGRIEGTFAFARLLATLGDADGATEAYEKLLTLGIRRDDEIDVRLILARRFASIGQVDRAADQARRILALDAANGEAKKLLD